MSFKYITLIFTKKTYKQIGLKQVFVAFLINNPTLPDIPTGFLPSLNIWSFMKVSSTKVPIQTKEMINAKTRSMDLKL
jgi:hypothetical protein